MRTAYLRGIIRPLLALSVGLALFAGLSGCNSFGNGLVSSDEGGAGAECRSGTSYTTTRREKYHEEQNNATRDTPCPELTPETEGDALDAAWKYFDGVAARYCSKGKCEKEGESCQATVSNRSATQTGTSREFDPAPGDTNRGTLRCYVTFQLKADIACTCQPSGA